MQTLLCIALNNTKFTPVDNIYRFALSSNSGHHILSTQLSGWALEIFIFRLVPWGDELSLAPLPRRAVQ
jgi:hypothetical protein